MHPIEYDVYLSYNNADQQLADKVTESLKETSNSIKIFTKQQPLNQNVSWQEEIYKVHNLSLVVACNIDIDRICLEYPYEENFQNLALLVTQVTSFSL